MRLSKSFLVFLCLQLSFIHSFPMSSSTLSSLKFDYYCNSSSQNDLLEDHVRCWHCDHHFHLSQFPKAGPYCLVCISPSKYRTTEEESSLDSNIHVFIHVKKHF